MRQPRAKGKPNHQISPPTRYREGMKALGWVLLVLGALLAAGLLGPLIGLALLILALPIALIAGAAVLPVVLVLAALGLGLGILGSLVGGLLAVLGFVIKYAVPILLVAFGLWLIAQSRRASRA
jgi:hypothetical protein